MSLKHIFLEDACTTPKVTKNLHPKFETAITHACIDNTTPKLVTTYLMPLLLIPIKYDSLAVELLKFKASHIWTQHKTGVQKAAAYHSSIPQYFVTLINGFHRYQS